MMIANFKSIWDTILDIILFRKYYRYRHITHEPSVIKDRVIYIVKDGVEDETLIFRCPCGCNADIYLNLLTDTRPVWKYGINKNRISISPSVWRTKGCKSHFVVNRGRVIWVD